MAELLWIVGAGFVLGVIAMFTSAEDLAESAQQDAEKYDEERESTKK
jgi:hypothetical protein